MDYKQFRAEIREPFYNQYSGVVEKRGYLLTVNRQKTPNGELGLEARLWPKSSSPNDMTSDKLTELQQLLGHETLYNGFPVNVSWGELVYAHK